MSYRQIETIVRQQHGTPIWVGGRLEQVAITSRSRLPNLWRSEHAAVEQNQIGTSRVEVLRSFLGVLIA